MRMILVAVLGLAFSAPASAQQLTLTFHEGRVTLDAAAVPVRTILSEWGRLGGTKVVGGDRITGAPLTIHLENVTEAQALEVVLRNVAGYMAAPRRAESTGASAYDRILVMPTSTAAAAAASNTGRPANGNNANMAGTQRGVRGGGPPPQAEEPVVQDAADSGVNEPAFSFPQQNPFQAIGQPGQTGQPGPFGTPIPPGAQSPVVQFGPGTGSPAVSVNPTQEQQMPVLQFPGAAPAGNGTTGGFGVIGSPTPGVIVQPAAPAQPGVRPPGGN
jgi:hypothetical protein